MIARPDPWAEVLGAVTVALSGERAEGRRRLLACWERSQPQQHAQRCVLAHYLADTEDDLDREVGWDQEALAEHAHVATDDLVAVGIPAAAALAPSLHLNLGDCHRRRGDLLAAREQVELGLAAVGTLTDDGYGRLVRGGLERLARDLDLRA